MSKQVLTILSIPSNVISVGRGLWQTDQRQGQRAEAIHDRQAEGHRRCYEGYEDGAHTEKGSDEGEALESILGYGSFDCGDAIYPRTSSNTSPQFGTPR